MSDLIPVEAVEAAAKVAAEDDAEPNGPHRVRNRPATNPRLDQHAQTKGNGMSDTERAELARLIERAGQFAPSTVEDLRLKDAEYYADAILAAGYRKQPPP